jgi:hypothetical protein
LFTCKFGFFGGINLPFGTSLQACMTVVCSCGQQRGGFLGINLNSGELKMVPKEIVKP